MQEGAADGQEGEGHLDSVEGTGWWALMMSKMLDILSIFWTVWEKYNIVLDIVMEI